MQVSNSIIFPIAKSPYKGVYILRINFSNVLHDIGLYIVGFLHEFLLDSLEKLLRLHQEWALHLNMLMNIIFRKFIKWQRSHGHPHYLIAMLRHSIDQLMVAIV